MVFLQCEYVDVWSDRILWRRLVHKDHKQMVSLQSGYLVGERKELMSAQKLFHKSYRQMVSLQCGYANEG